MGDNRRLTDSDSLLAMSEEVTRRLKWFAENRASPALDVAIMKQLKGTISVLDRLVWACEAIKLNMEMEAKEKRE